MTDFDFNNPDTYPREFFKLVAENNVSIYGKILCARYGNTNGVLIAMTILYRDGATVMMRKHPELFMTLVDRIMREYDIPLSHLVAYRKMAKESGLTAISAYLKWVINNHGNQVATPEAITGGCGEYGVVDTRKLRDEYFANTTMNTPNKPYAITQSISNGIPATETDDVSVTADVYEILMELSMASEKSTYLVIMLSQDKEENIMEQEFQVGDVTTYPKRVFKWVAKNDNNMLGDKLKEEYGRYWLVMYTKLKTTYAIAHLMKTYPKLFKKYVRTGINLEYVSIEKRITVMRELIQLAVNEGLPDTASYLKELLGGMSNQDELVVRDDDESTPNKCNGCPHMDQCDEYDASAPTNPDKGDICTIASDSIEEVIVFEEVESQTSDEDTDRTIEVVHNGSISVNELVNRWLDMLTVTESEESDRQTPADDDSEYVSEELIALCLERKMFKDLSILQENGLLPPGLNITRG